MTSQTGSDRPARAMRQLIDELRREEPPAVDWERVEGEVISRIAPMAAVRRVGAPLWQRKAWLGVSTFAAAAAAIALFVSSPAPISVSQQEAEASEVVVSGAEPQRFQLEGLATWVLAPRSRAVLRCSQTDDDGRCLDSAGARARSSRAGLPSRSSDSPYVVVLERGALAADVVPEADPSGIAERFVVEAGGVRVAVHGTRFTVERHADEVTVEVTRGAVTVGPAGHRGLTTGHLLVAPARAAFSLDGAKVARMLPPTRRLAARASGPGSPAAAEGASPWPAEALRRPNESAAPTPDEETRDDVHRRPADTPERSASGSDGPSGRDTTADTPAEPAPSADMSVGQAQARMIACLQSPAASSAKGDAVRVTISSSVRVRLDGERRVVAIKFTPPLKPELQARCAGVLFGQRLAEGTGATAEFPVQFTPRVDR